MNTVTVIVVMGLFSASCSSPKPAPEPWIPQAGDRVGTSFCATCPNKLGPYRKLKVLSVYQDPGGDWFLRLEHEDSEVPLNRVIRSETP